MPVTEESLSAHQSRTPSKSLQMFVGPVETLQLVCLVQWCSGFSPPYLARSLSTEHLEPLGLQVGAVMTMTEVEDNVFLAASRLILLKSLAVN